MTPLQICAMILTRLGFENETLTSLLEKWRFFIGECEDGYQWDYSEYVNEVRARYLIEQLLCDETVSNADEFKEQFIELDKLDQRFQELLQPKVVLEKGEGWWDKGVLKRAGGDYCQYMYDAHEITVDSID